MRKGQQWAEGRGEEISGEKGEGFVGTIIKDTWIITRVGGWKREGGAEGWGLGWGRGKKAENCTWTKN